MAYVQSSWRQNTQQQDPTWRGYQDYTNRMQGYGGGLMGGVMAGAPIGAGGQLQSQYRADPSGAGVKNYMANVMGGQRQSVNDYTNRAYAAGMAGRRGGTGVVGGMDPLSSMHQQANQALARGYGDRFQNAMENEWRGADQALNAWRSQGQLGSEFSGRELAGRQAGSDWEWKMYQDQLEREKLAEDTRRWNMQWGRGTEDWNRQRQWSEDDRRRQQYAQQQQMSQAQGRQQELDELTRSWYFGGAPQMYAGTNMYPYAAGVNNYLNNALGMENNIKGMRPSTTMGINPRMQHTL